MKLGVFVKCPHPEMIEALGIAGADFAVVDMEHTPLGPRDLYPLVLAAERRNLRLVVRIPENAPHWFKWALDLGVREIQVPDVRTLEDMVRAVDSCVFPTVGKRGLCRFVRAADYSAMLKDDYIDRAMSTTLIIQIEHWKALDHLDGFLHAANAVLIGPYDLSASLGMPGMVAHPSVLDCIDNIIGRCKLHTGASVGIFVDSPADIARYRELGVDFIEYGSDLQLLMGAVKELKNG